MLNFVATVKGLPVPTNPVVPVQPGSPFPHVVPVPSPVPVPVTPVVQVPPGNAPIVKPAGKTYTLTVNVSGRPDETTVLAAGTNAFLFAVNRKDNVTLSLVETDATGNQGPAQIMTFTAVGTIKSTIPAISTIELVSET